MQKLPPDELEPQIRLLAGLNRGYNLDVNTHLAFEAVLEKLPSIDHVARVIRFALESGQFNRLPYPHELLAIHREQVAAARPKAECQACRGSGWNHVEIRGYSCAKRCRCIREPLAVHREPSGPRPHQPLDQLAQEKSI